MISVRSIFCIACAVFLALSHSAGIADAIGSSSSHTTTLIIPTAGNSKLADLSVDIFAALLPDSETSSLQLVYTDNSKLARELMQEHPDYIIAGLPQFSDIRDSFSWVGPMYSLRSVVIVGDENEKSIRITQPSDLSEYRVGILTYDNTAGIVSEFVSPNRIVGAQTLPDLFTLLASEQIDVIVTEHLHVAEYLTDHYALGDYEFIFFLPPVPHYYAFAGDTNPAIIASYQSALDTIKTTPNDGDVRYTQYEEIVSKNFLPSTFRSSHYVLIFSLYDASTPRITKILDGMSSIFSSTSNIRYNFESLCMDCLPFDSSVDTTAYVTLIAEAAMSHHHGVTPDAIISIGLEAFHAAQHYASLHDSTIPIIYGMAAPGDYRNKESSGILWTYAIGKIISLAKQTHPGRDVIYVISSQDRSNQLILEKIRDIDALDSKSIFYYAPYDLSLEDLIQDINAHSNAIVLLNDYRFYDGPRPFYLTAENMHRLTSSISAPVYTLTDVFNHNAGVVEAYEISMERVGELLGIMTSRVLFGEEISNIPTYIYSPLTPRQETTSPIPTPKDLLALLGPYFSFTILLLLCLLAIAGIWLSIQRKIFHTLDDMRKSQKILERRIGAMPVAIAVFPLDSDEHIFINEAMNQVIDSGFTYYISASYEEFSKIKNSVAQNKETYKEERESDTGKQIFQFNVHPIHDSMGSVQLIMIQAIDVTKTRTKERETSAALMRLDQFVERNVAGVAFFQPIYDEDDKLRSGVYHKVNREFCELMHLYSEDLLGKELGGFLIRKDILELFSTLTDTSPPVRFSYFQSEDDGQFLSAFVFKIGINSPLFCLSLTDETEYYYHRLIEISATQKLEAMLKELAILNDQIRNPLTVILCSLEADTIHAQSDFNVHINNINTAIDLLDRRFLIVDSLRARIKEKEHMRSDHVVIEFDSSNSHDSISTKEDF